MKGVLCSLEQIKLESSELLQQSTHTHTHTHAHTHTGNAPTSGFTHEESEIDSERARVPVIEKQKQRDILHLIREAWRDGAAASVSGRGVVRE